MGEILVAQGKRRRSAALGWNGQKETVRAKNYIHGIDLLSDGIEFAIKNVVT